VPVRWQTKNENADLNLETIAELTGYFTRLEDLDKKREKSSFKTSKDSEKITKSMKTIRSKLKVGNTEREIASLMKKKLQSIASSICPIHMIPMNVRPRRSLTLRSLTETHKRQMLLHPYLITSVMTFQQASSLLQATMDLMSIL
jgi:hypothetical protein